MTTMSLLLMTSCNRNSSTTNGNTIQKGSQETFGNNADADKEAIEASIFALNNEGKIVALESIRLQGTLYPVSLLNGKIMVAIGL